MLRLRPAIDSDRRIVFRLHEELFRGHIEQIWGWQDDWQRCNFNGDWAESQNEVIENNVDWLGYVQTQRRYGPDELYLLNLAVTPANQGGGIGEWVMRQLMLRAIEQSLPIRLSVFRTNPAALRFYLRLGFEPEVTTDTSTFLVWREGR